MRIERRYTKSGQSPYDLIPFRRAVSEIRNQDGSIVFHMADIEVPADWSQVAVDVLAQKYFRKAGVPDAVAFEDDGDGVPAWLMRRTPFTDSELGSETSAKQVFDRLAGCWTYWGWKGGYFAPKGAPKGVVSPQEANLLTDQAEENARAFYDELRFMLASQMVAPNSPLSDVSTCGTD